MAEAPPCWDPDAVWAANTEWVWLPDGAPHVRTDELVVVARPPESAAPTAVHVFGSRRDPEELIEVAHDLVRGLGRTRAWWTVSDQTRPAGLEAALRSRGGQVAERTDVLALPLGPDQSHLAAPVGHPCDVTVERVTDAETVRTALEVEAAAFEWPAPTEQQLVDGLAEIERGADGSVGRVVAYVGGRPAGVGGWGLVGEVCRLWGAGTHPDLRGRGVYHAVLAHRLRIGSSHGASLALTHGRVDTSSPILRRVGFTRYGEQRQIVLDL